jgi:hypothetical protein
MIVLLSHLLAAYMVLAAPWVGCLWYRNARKRIASGDRDAKVKLYRSLVAEQIATTAAVLALWGSGAVPAASLGLAAPRSWTWSMAGLLAILSGLAWSSLQLRPKAAKIRQKIQDGIGALLPSSHRERTWWGAVSLGAGISEELVCRGFLLYYCMVYLPHTNLAERVVLTSLVFGLAHIYQGWKGAVAAGILGAAFACIYLVTGSLLLPVVIHAAVDSRILLMFPPEESLPVAECKA